jgi:hypothetical protein
MLIEVAYASELAEALLDAVEMVMEKPTPVAVVEMSDYIVATRVFDPEEALIIVFPSSFPIPEILMQEKLAA